ncbi:protein-S-isoprenylcysteine O-methyltransferase Ste14 [Brevundimonas alba]|uniref:Protein-S-isoprenylcysteine O-methyltransferase Ste14 n=1 Tax=Brevundimonas alba TaxID=74314 RepID=A0A7X5YMC8_9CAUL|nr:isoprenylcysteine carboxylmethyltransferase family protein [Brevundimonas alba]NJC42588.1 protein-S-isoprenylcysteine O-methyltransferase Ste14 [Brevundimonas alba]
MHTADPHHLRRVQLIRKAALGVALLLVIGLAALTQSFGGVAALHEGLEALGLAMIAICVVGRAWCSLYIGGRKKAEIVDQGPYSISRNPLYVFSFIGSFGMGAQTGSVVIATLFVVISVAVFYLTVRQEEGWLSVTFGEVYRAYCARTPRFLPDFSKWQDRETLEVRPVFFLTTLRDGLGFFLAVPLFEALEHAQTVGWVHVVFNLP